MWFGWLQSPTFAAFAWDDPLPAFVDTPVVIGRILGRRRAEKRARHDGRALSGASVAHR